jgi:hypothetical protein
MRIIATIALLLASLSYGLTLLAAPPASEQTAIDALAKFYEQHGSAPLANQLREGFKNKTVVFGEVEGDDNAMYDHGSKLMTLNRSLPEKLTDQAAGQMFNAKAAAAMTVAHEFEHARQSWFAWHRARANERLGYGNQAEQAAWKRGFEAGAEWIRFKKRELDRLIAEGKSQQERAGAAAELRDLCATWQVYVNDYVAVRKGIGDIVVSNPTLPLLDGFPEEQADPVAFQDKVKELQQEAVGIVRIAQAMAVSFDGEYRGKISGRSLTANVTFTVKNFEVKGLVRGLKGLDPLYAEIRGQVDADGRVTLLLKDAQVTETIDGKPFTTRLSGKATGLIDKFGAASGKWNSYMTSAPDLVLGQDDGTWDAQR